MVVGPQEDTGSVGRHRQDETAAVLPQAGVRPGELVNRQAEAGGKGFGFPVLKAHLAGMPATGPAALAGPAVAPVLCRPRRHRRHFPQTVTTDGS